MKNKIECLQENASLEQVISKINDIIERIDCEIEKSVSIT